MKKFTLTALCLLLTLGSFAQWKPAGDKIKTTWAEKIDPNNVLPEYPRPIMERGEWKNLNGLWEYAIIEKGKQVAVCKKFLNPCQIQNKFPKPS